MVPREHGAYGQLLLPMATAMALGRPSIAAAALVVCAFALFAAHEPLLVVLGRRGERARRELGGAARRWLFAWALMAAAASAVALARLDGAGRLALVAPLGLAALSGGMVVCGRERTIAGEIVVSTTLASLSLPVAAACGVSTSASLACAATFAAAFAVATVSVHAVIANARGGAGAERRWALAMDVLLLATVAALAAWRIIPSAALWATLPVGCVALGMAATVPPPRYLRRIGWMLVAATVLCGGILAAGIR